MTVQEIIDGNVIIAKWLGWERTTWKHHRLIFNGFKIEEPWELNILNDKILDGDLAFHRNSNWQWLCLEKIAKDLGYSIEQVWLFQLTKLLPYEYIESKLDLFEAIINYILNAKLKIE